MKRFTARSRIALAITCLSITLLAAAHSMGLLPDPDVAARSHRGRLCEMIAIRGTTHITNNELRHLETTIQAIVQRNPEILSAAIRERSGRVIADTGPHDQLWTVGDAAQRSTDSHVVVPLRNGPDKWGQVEVCFVPLTQKGVIGFFKTPLVRLTTFMAAAGFLVYSFFLRRVLEHLDPSRVVPGRVRSALDTLSEGLLMLDKNERIVLSNQAFSTITGLPPQQLLGKKASSLDWLMHDKTDSDYPWLAALKQKDLVDGETISFKSGNDKRRTFLVNCSPIMAGGGHRGVLVSFEDVTQLETTKVALAKSRDDAERASQAKSDFLAHMSHEIRTPMNAILGFTDVLMRGMATNDAERTDYLETIHASGSHLLELINDILDLSKIEAGRLEIENTPCQPAKLVSQVVSVLSVRAEEKDIAFDFVVEGEIPETIQSDETRLRQILMNLAGNAVKFTTQGGVRIIMRLNQKSGRPMMQFDVCDTGIGISPAGMEKIFDPFSQADGSITRKFGGTGLGLSISQRLATALGGELTARSEEGTGSVFTVTVDPGCLDGVPMRDANDLEKLVYSRTSKKSGTIILPPARILVADDGESNRKLITLVLARAGLEVETVENGKDALEAAESGDFDVIFMDMQMPIMDGLTATELLRQRGYLRPIVALTAHAMDGDRERCLNAGCNAYLTKPIKLDQVFSTLSDILGPADERRIAEMQARSNQLDSSIDSDEMQVVQTADEGAIVSTLPSDDIEFQEIVVEFLQRFRGRLVEMESMVEQGQYVELSNAAHWLKGAGGTAGFDILTEVARELEDAAKSENKAQIAHGIQQLNQIRSRIVTPSLVNASAE